MIQYVLGVEGGILRVLKPDKALANHPIDHPRESLIFVGRCDIDAQVMPADLENGRRIKINLVEISVYNF